MLTVYLSAAYIYGEVPMKVRELVAELRRRGYTFLRQKGGHQQWLSPSGTRVTVRYHNPSQEADPKAVRTLLRK